MNNLKTHGFVRAMGGLIMTPCGVYLDGPDKERVEADSSKVTCGNCKRTHEHANQEFHAGWQQVLYGRVRS